MPDFDLDAIEAAHQHDDDPENRNCRCCGQDWPCDVRQLVAYIRELERHRPRGATCGGCNWRHGEIGQPIGYAIAHDDHRREVALRAAQAVT